MSDAWSRLGIMSIEVRPAVEFDDVAALVGPKKPTSNVCFCLSYRIPSKEANALRGPDRADRVRRLMDEEGPIGVLAYDGDRWAPWEDRPAQRLPHGVQASLEIEGRPLRVAGAKGPAAAAPQVLILSSGELSPFRLELAERRAAGLRLELSSDGFRLSRVQTLGAGG